MTDFEPLRSAIGGGLIGLAAGWLLLANGRIAGISGILGSALMVGTDPEERGWRLCFLIGLPLGAGLVSLVDGGLPMQLDASWPMLAGAGLLVGFGTRLGNGCTSGHGVCGMARGSSRSIAATLTFMATGGLVVFAVRHLFAT